MSLVSRLTIFIVVCVCFSLSNLQGGSCSSRDVRLWDSVERCDADGVCKALACGASPHARIGPRGETLVQRAVCQHGDGALPIVKALCAAGLRGDESDKVACTAFHKAAFRGKYVARVIGLLASCEGAQIDQANLLGLLPLNIAVRCADASTVRALIKAGSDTKAEGSFLGVPVPWRLRDHRRCRMVDVASCAHPRPCEVFYDMSLKEQVAVFINWLHLYKAPPFDELTFWGHQRGVYHWDDVIEGFKDVIQYQKPFLSGAAARFVEKHNVRFWRAYLKPATTLYSSSAYAPALCDCVVQTQHGPVQNQ